MKRRRSGAPPLVTPSFFNNQEGVLRIVYIPGLVVAFGQGQIPVASIPLAKNL